MGPSIPQTVCDRVKLLSSMYSESTIMELTGLGRASLYRIKKRGFRALRKGPRPRPRPSDFAIQERHLSADALARHYHTSNNNIARWRRELRGSGQ